MKNIIISLLFTMVALLSQAQDYVIDSIEYVASETNYITNTTKVKTLRYRSFTYNKDGQCLTENYWIEGRNHPSVTYVYDYDSNGNLVRLSTNFYGENQMEEVGATEYTYYENDMLRSMVKYTYGRQNRKEVSDSAFYKYDDHQRLCYEYKKWPYGETYIYDYDPQGNVIKKTIYQGHEITRIERMMYDGNGHILYKQGTNQTSKDSIDYSYNEKGLLKQEIHYGWKNKEYVYSSRYYYYYNENSRLIKLHEDQYYSSYGKFFGFHEEEYEYDDNGNIICNHYKGLQNGNIVDKGVITLYDYDKDGNTIKIHRQTYEGGTWKDCKMMEDMDFSYNNRQCIFENKVSTDVISVDSILISYQNKKNWATSVIPISQTKIQYTITGNVIRFNLADKDFKYMSVFTLAGQYVHYVKPVATLARGMNIVSIKTSKGNFTYKIFIQ